MYTIPQTMKAIVLSAYDRLETVELPVPKPGPGEALCRIRAVAICGSDPKMIHGYYADAGWPPYFPFVMGHEWAGEVVALGEGVTEFKIGDRVAGEAHKGCGSCENCKNGRYTICLNYGKDGVDGREEKRHRHYGFHYRGANAQYNAYAVESLHRIPDNVSFEAASLCDTAGVAMHGIELVGITPGGVTAVFGPGPIGLCAMQIAKGLGAGRVIMVGRGGKLQTAGELGADDLIDFEKEDPVERILELTGGRGCDEVLECSGAGDSPRKACFCVKKGGAVALIANYREDRGVEGLPLNRIVFNELLVRGSKANPNVSDQVLAFLSKGVIDGGRIVTHTFPLEAYEEAVKLFERKKDGSIKVVIKP